MNAPERIAIPGRPCSTDAAYTPRYQSERVTLYCADCLDVLPQLTGVDAVVTDPPYNIGFEYGWYTDTLTDDQYIDGLSNFQNMPVAMMQYPEEMMRTVVPALGPPEYVSAWCYNGNLPRHFRLVGYWGGLKPDYSRIKQPYKNPTDKRVVALIEAGSEGTPLYEWWSDIQQVKNVSEEKTLHPCPVPIKLMERIILLTTDPGQVVFDPFMGSGTTGVACMQLGRRFIGIEIDETYYQIAERRIRGAEAQLHLAGVS